MIEELPTRYVPSPRPTYSQPTLVSRAEVRRHVWGDREAGLAYPLLVPLAFGFGGQAPIFYNLPVAIAALLVAGSLEELAAGRVPRRRVVAPAPHAASHPLANP